TIQQSTTTAKAENRCFLSSSSRTAGRKYGCANVLRSMTIEQLLRNRIAILDGAMGTMIQAFKLDEAGYRGHFKNHPSDLKGNNDLLSITQPEIIKSIHRQY